ncbi:CIC11C00000000370 [Sungouiella intermedia]|uniref:CIC11C00000000370 n=2 Tax=Sungouiella intermedia TaxID=45354 RepID=A0A1L0BQX5_9ASCO|nr:CIC11C00000000370 [[Candida] intermedia]
MPPKKQPKASSPSYEFPQKFYALKSSLEKLFYKPQPESLVDDQIVVIDHFFSSEFCDELIASFLSSLKMETTPLIKSRDYAARFNDRASFTSYDAADSLWQYLKEILLQQLEYEDEDMEAVGSIFRNAKSLNPQLRIYRYTKGHHFGKHYDESVRCPLAHDPKIQGKTKWTLLIYLTGDDEFKGGGTIFYPDVGKEYLNVHPSKGMALLHKHGDDCLKHEAELVKDGVKWVLRSDVTY